MTIHVLINYTLFFIKVSKKPMIEVDEKNEKRELIFKLFQRRWNIRKAQKLDGTLSKKRGRILPFNPRKLMRNDEVFFWQSNDEDCDCIGDFENCENTCCVSVVTATVMINDPFLRQCMVVDDEGKEFFVSQRQLLDETAQDETNEGSRPSVPKKRCPPKTIPFVDAIALIPHSDENVELKYAPCYNNILKVGSLTNYANATFEVKELFFDCSKRKAFVKLIGKIPALEVQVIEDEIEEFNIHTLVHPINQAFAVFSTVKRMVGFAKKKTFNDQINNSSDPIDQ